VVTLDALLLDSKLSVPQPRPGSVSRAGLIETARGSGCRVVGVTAPAGYGKSTLLAEWALAEDRRVAWVSLDRFDDDPALVLSLLASAYARVWPASADLIADVSGAGLSVLGRAAPRLASAFRASPVPFVLMLDDLHELRSPACHDVLGVVISGIPQALSWSRRAAAQGDVHDPLQLRLRRRRPGQRRHRHAVGQRQERGRRPDREDRPGLLLHRRHLRRGRGLGHTSVAGLQASVQVHRHLKKVTVQAR
jgi:hypothetical protein